MKIRNNVNKLINNSCESKQKKIILARFILNLMDSVMYTKMTFKKIISNKNVNCSSRKDQLSINTKNINKETNKMYVNKQTSTDNFGWK